MREKPVIRLVNLRWTASILFMLLVVRDDQARRGTIFQYWRYICDKMLKSDQRIVAFFDVKLLRIRRARACAL